MDEKVMKITLSKKGIPCLWECGGGMSNTGEAIIICNKEGKPKMPIYIRQRGHLSNSDHALIPVMVGDVVIETNHHRNDHITKVWSIVEIKKDEETCNLSIISSFDNGEWDNENYMQYQEAIQAAWDKSMTYHCRKAFYIAVNTVNEMQPLSV